MIGQARKQIVLMALVVIGATTAGSYALDSANHLQGIRESAGAVIPAS